MAESADAYPRPARWERATDAELFTEETVEDLDLAQQEIIRRGWVQGDYIKYATDSDPSSGVCLLGGLDCVTANRRSWIVRCTMDRYLEQAGVGYEGTIAGWNDEPGRTVHDVLEVLTGASRWVKEKIND